MRDGMQVSGVLSQHGAVGGTVYDVDQHEVVRKMVIDRKSN